MPWSRQLVLSTEPGLVAMPFPADIHTHIYAHSQAVALNSAVVRAQGGLILV